MLVMAGDVTFELVLREMGRTLSSGPGEDRGNSMSRINVMSPVPSRPLLHDTAMLFALRAVLTMAFLGLSCEWLATQPAFS